MKQKLINDVVNDMLPYLNNAQMERLQTIMQHVLFEYEITDKGNKEMYTHNKADGKNNLPMTVFVILA